MLLNESSFDFALCVICYLSIALDLSYVLFLDILVFYSTLVLCVCVFFFAFASRSCLWPLLLFWLSFCKFRFSSLALIFGFFSAFASYYFFHFSFMAVTWFSFLVFVSLFVFGSCQVLIFHFYFSFFCLWPKTHYNGPKVTNVMFIISPLHSVKLESLFQNREHSPLKQKICGFQERLP